MSRPLKIDWSEVDPKLGLMPARKIAEEMAAAGVKVSERRIGQRIQELGLIPWQGHPNRSGLTDGQQARMLNRLRRVIAENANNKRPGGHPNPYSRRSAAKAIGVADRTLRRWIAGDLSPTPMQTRRIVAWLDRMDR